MSVVDHLMDGGSDSSATTLLLLPLADNLVATTGGLPRPFDAIQRGFREKEEKRGKRVERTAGSL
jgi:hypothetical protein